MTRVKRGTAGLKRRKNLLKLTKGYRHGRKNKKREAFEAMVHAGNHAFAHRRDKKNVFRQLWQVNINYAVRPFGLSYSAFVSGLKKKEIGLNRKMLASIARDNPETFKRIVEEVK